MEPEQPATVVNNKPSGLPRPSRLPILRSNLSQLSLQDAVEQQKSSNTTTKVQKPYSAQSFSKPRQPASKSSIATGNSLSTKRTLANGSNQTSISSNNTNNTYAAPVKPLSGLNSQGSLQRECSISSNQDTKDNQDELGSLDGFRADSQQRIRDDLPTEPQEFVEGSHLPKSPTKRKASRASLSDRTIDSIQRLPSTPKDRRRSSFFSPLESPMGPPPRPSSSLSRNGSKDRSRPSTNDGTSAKPFPLPSPNAMRAPMSAKPMRNSSTRSLESTSDSLHQRTLTSVSSTRIQGEKTTIPQSPRSSLPSTPVTTIAKSSGQRVSKPIPGSRTVATRSTNPRPSLTTAFGPMVREATSQRRHAGEGKLPKEVSALDETTPTTVTPSKSSSAALRQQIAAARAAARKAKTRHDSPQSLSTGTGSPVENEMYANPFGQAPKDSKHMLRNRIKSARMDGKLNIAALELKEVPDEVLKMYDAKAMEENNVSWAEVVDLTRLIAADNEIEELSESVFPDKAAEDFDMDDNAEGNQFGGLEMLDLHGNRLTALPLGLRRLERLTSLNLAHNKLENSVFDVLSQITSIKDLKLGYNALSGTLPGSISNLERLESLDLQSNRLLGLPEALRELVNLRVLNISSNQLTTVPMEALRELPLAELDASSNALIASLFPIGGTSGHPSLQNLKVANNSLAALTFDERLELPRLRTLDVTNNNLTSLPPVSTFTELITLAAGDNKIATLPEGFTSLQRLRNANFSSNELRLLDYEIANMESLESLIVAQNPLREKKFLTMNAADIKQDLKARLTPSESEEVEPPHADIYHSPVDGVLAQKSSPSSSWALKGDTLDLAGKGYSNGINDSLDTFMRSNKVNRLYLQSNKLTTLLPALRLGRDLRLLDLSGNTLHYEYLSDELDLPSLQELNLSRCNLNTLEPLVTGLQAPSLHTLNITANRLSGALPTLRRSYSSLTTLLAGDNRFTSITADSLHGFHTVNLASNNIERLPPELGLLWDEGLRNLEVGSNAFRVPSYQIMAKGTEALMRWLRDKMPASHGAPEMSGSVGLHGNTH